MFTRLMFILSDLLLWSFVLVNIWSVDSYKRNKALYQQSVCIFPQMKYCLDPLKHSGAMYATCFNI
jgi:hypothetical protein